MYIGVSGYNHESSAALVNDEGVLIDYYREEILSRVKGDKSFPKRSLKKIVENNHLNINQIKAVAFYERPLSSFLIPMKIAALNMPQSLPLMSHQLRNFKKSSVSFFLDLSIHYPGLEKNIVYLDHHLSHTLTALAYSELKNDICSIVVDGFGDRSTASISHVNNYYDIKELWACEYPQSLGLFYSAITDFLGFQINEGEYKVMGLSAFGDSHSEFASLIKNIIRWDKRVNNLSLDISYFDYHISLKDSFSQKLVELIGEPRNPFIPLDPEDNDFQKYADIARGAQDAVVDILRSLFEHAYSLTGSKKYLLSGGVAMNSAALDQLSTLSFVEEIIVPPSPGDAGSSIGSAYYAYLKGNPNLTKRIHKPSLFPSNYDFKDQKNLAKKIISKNFILLSKDEECSLSLVANLIEKGEVIGILINNSETGPRALGNRSLICDGKNPVAVKALNSFIKNRSPFRPTAPSMKLETAQKYYCLRPELAACYQVMGATCKCKIDSKALNFPTTHIDGTVRLQIVEEGHLLDNLLDSLKKYDIDILANSSLNVSGDPTCYDLIDGLMLCSRNPLKYLLTDFGLLEKKLE